MPKYRLKNDVSIMFNGGGRDADGYEVTAKSGDPVRMVMGGQGPSFALVTGKVAQSVAAIYAHDSKYYYVWVAPEDVEEVEE